MKLSVLVHVPLICASLTLPSHAQSPVPIKNFDVFVDPPTGFVFVKLPMGWKFVGALQARDLASLPPTVITSLLSKEPAESAVSAVVPEGSR